MAILSTERFEEMIRHLLSGREGAMADSISMLQPGTLVKVSAPGASILLQKRVDALEPVSDEGQPVHLDLAFSDIADLLALDDITNSQEFGRRVLALWHEGKVNVNFVRNFKDWIESGVGHFAVETGLLAQPDSFRELISPLTLKDIAFTDILDVSYLQGLVEELARSTGVRLWVLDMNCHPVAMSIAGGEHCRTILNSYKGAVRCYESAVNSLADLAGTLVPRVRKCHAGFVCFDAPLILNGEIVGMITGDGSIPESPEPEVYRAMATELEIDPEELLKSLDQVRHLNINEMEFILSIVNAIGSVVTEMSLKQYFLTEKVRELNILNRVSALLSTQLREDLGEVYTKVAEAVASLREGTTCELELGAGDEKRSFTGGPGMLENGSSMRVDVRDGKQEKVSIGLGKPAGLEGAGAFPDTRFLESIGSQISMAMQNSALYGELKLKNEELKKLFALTTEITEKERARISRDLHDDTGQNLTLALLNLEILAGDKRIGQKNRKQVESASSSISAVLEQLHNLSVELHPPVLDLGLTEALNNLLRRMNSENNVNFKLEINGEEPVLSHEEKINLYRIVQEALSNTIKHSGAREALVCLSYHANGIDLLVSDNGRGCVDVVRDHRVHLGLVNMRERAEQIGGTFNLLTSCAGTSIAVHVPLHPEAGPETPAEEDKGGEDD
jgi:signal transduction histidine kinase